MTNTKYYTGRYFAAFLGATLFIVAALFAGLYGVHSGFSHAGVAINTAAASAAPTAMIGFALGVFGGGTVLMLTGWYLVRK